MVIVKSVAFADRYLLVDFDEPLPGGVTTEDLSNTVVGNQSYKASIVYLDGPVLSYKNGLDKLALSVPDHLLYDGALVGEEVTFPTARPLLEASRA